MILCETALHKAIKFSNFLILVWQNWHIISSPFSNLWWMANAVNKAFETAMKRNSSKRFHKIVFELQVGLWHSSWMWELCHIFISCYKWEHYLLFRVLGCPATFGEASGFCRAGEGVGLETLWHQVCTLSHFFLFPFLYKIIDMPGGQINYPSCGKHFSLSVPPNNSLVSISDHWRPFWLNSLPFRGPCLALCIASRTTEN